MADRGDYRDGAAGDRTRHDFLVERPQVLDRSTAAADENDVDPLYLGDGSEPSCDIERGAVPLFVNGPYRVREKWIGVDELGNDVVLEGRVSFGDAWFPTLGPNADILLEGERAVLEPLAGMNRIQGKLTLTGGNELRLAQSLTNEGALRLASAGKLYIDGNLLTTGELDVGADSYLDVSGAISPACARRRRDRRSTVHRRSGRRVRRRPAVQPGAGRRSCRSDGRARRGPAGAGRTCAAIRRAGPSAAASVLTTKEVLS